MLAEIKYRKSQHGSTSAEDCGSVLYDSYMNHWVKKNSLDGVQRAFQHLGINCGQLVSNILEHRVDHRGSGRLPFPSERRHFRADSPPVGWIIGSFYQPLRFETVDQLGDVGPVADELRGPLAAASSA